MNGLQFVTTNQKQELPVDSQVTVKIAGCSNPLTSKKTGTYSVFIKAADGSIKAEMSDTARDESTLTMTEPAQI